MDGYGRSSYGEAFADVYDDWYADVTPARATAAFVADRIDGTVLELGSGTGRLAAPMAELGLTVIGLDSSPAMLARSRTIAPDVATCVADMAELPIRPGSVAGVLVGFNTLFNLPSRALQRVALAQVARALAPGGALIIEAFVPLDRTDVGSDRPHDVIDISRIDSSSVVLRVSRTDWEAGTVSGHHVELRDGEPVRLRPWSLCFAAPSEIDAMAAHAGLELAERHGGWSGEAFDAASDLHVSVYRRGPSTSVSSPR